MTTLQKGNKLLKVPEERVAAYESQGFAKVFGGESLGKKGEAPPKKRGEAPSATLAVPGQGTKPAQKKQGEAAPGKRGEAPATLAVLGQGTKPAQKKQGETPPKKRGEAPLKNAEAPPEKGGEASER